MSTQSLESAVPAQAVVLPEHAVDETFQLDRVLLTSTGHFVHDFYTAFLAPLLPLLIENLSLTTTMAGGLIAFMQWPSIFQPLVGGVADRTSTRYFFLAGPLLTGIGMSLLLIMPSYGALAFLLVLVGLSSSSLHATGPVIISRVSGRNLGRGAGFWMVGGELGRTVGPVAIVAVVDFLMRQGVPLQVTPLLMIGGMVISTLLFFQFRGLPRHYTSNAQRASAPWGAALRGMAPVMLPIAGILIARTFMTQALMTYLPLFLNREGATLVAAGAGLSLLEAAGVAGSLLGGSLSDKLGRRQVLAMALGSAALLMLVFMAVEGWPRIPLLIALGVTSFAAVPILMATVLESFPDNRALANGLYMAVMFLSSSGAAIVMGAVADSYSLGLAFTLSAVVQLAGLPLVLLLPKRTGPQ